MKKLLFILLLLPFISKAQYVVPRGLPVVNTSYYNLKGSANGGFVLIDSAMMMRGGGDTLMKPLYPAIKYAYSDYWWWNMIKWQKLSGGGGSSQGLQDVITVDPNLTTDNTIDGGGHLFSIVNTGSAQIIATDGSDIGRIVLEGSAGDVDLIATNKVSVDAPIVTFDQLGGGVDGFMGLDVNGLASHGQFSTGLTLSGINLTANISTGVSGGQTAYGGTGAGDGLTFASTINGSPTSTAVGFTFRSNLTMGTIQNNGSQSWDLGTMVNGTSALKYIATFPSSITATRSAVDFQITTQGSSSFVSRGVNSDLLAGYTGTSGTVAGRFGNLVAGNGANLYLSASNRGVAGSSTQVNGVGYNVGVSGNATFGKLNVGVLGVSGQDDNSHTNIGGVFFASNQAGGAIQLGLYAGLDVVDPTFESAGAIISTAGQAVPILLLKGTNAVGFGPMVTVKNDGRTFIGGGTTPTAILHLAGSASGAGFGALKFADGSAITATPEAGLMQFTAGLWFIDATNVARDTIAGRGWARANLGGGGGSGTVTTVSVVTNQGVSGSVATATTTPAITLSLGALTGVTSFNGLVVTANTGTITTGTWNGTTIAVANGGTGITSFGTGVSTALGVNVGSAGAFVVNGGALGTPSSGVLTSATGLPLTTGVTGILPAANGGTGVNNGSSTITLGGNLTLSGAFATTITVTGTTGVTLPTSGTLITSSVATLSSLTSVGTITTGTWASTISNAATATLRDDRFTLQDDGDVTKQAVFQLSGITASTTRTYTAPDASGTLALTTAIGTGGTDVAWSAAGGLSIPDASTTARGLINTGAQTIPGAKTWNGTAAFATGFGSAASGASQLFVGTGTFVYRTTNGGTNILMQSVFDVDNGIAAGNQAFGFETAGGFLFTAGNGTRRTLRASLKLTNLTNTAGSEAADLGIATQSGGTAASVKFTIGGTGNITIANGNLSLATAGNALLITEGSNGRVGQTTLVAGTKAITITGLTTSSRGFVTLVAQGGTSATVYQYAAVCTANTLTISAVTVAGALINTDTSVINYFVIN